MEKTSMDVYLFALSFITIITVWALGLVALKLWADSGIKAMLTIFGVMGLLVFVFWYGGID